METPQRLILFALLAIMSVGAFRLASDIGSGHNRGQHAFDPKSEEVENVVNHHLQVTDQKLRIQNDLAQIQVGSPPSVGDRIWPEKPQNKGRGTGSPSGGVDLSTDPREQVAFEDLDRDKKEFSKYKSPNSVIQNENSDRERAAIAARDYQELYAQQFIENARAHGYQVRLNENYVVIEVKRIKSTDQFKVQGLESSTSE